MRSLVLALFLAAFGPLGCTPKPTTVQESTPAPEVQPAPAAVVEEKPAPAPAPESKPAVTPLPERVRIVAWNLEWYPGRKPEPTPDEESEHVQVVKLAVEDLKPEVLLLEEVRDWQSAADLCSVLPGVSVQVTSAFQPRPQNQVVASRFPADSAWSESWQPDPANPPRGYSFAALELPGPHYLLTYALHLKSNLGELEQNIAMREASVRQMLKHAKSMLALYGKRGPCAVVIGGDMNTSIDDPKFKNDQSLRALIEAGFYWTHESVPFANRTTIPGHNGFADNCFDHIFTAGLGKPVAEVKPYPGISDHEPVLLDVELAKADFQPQIDVAKGLALLDRSAEAARKRASEPQTVTTLGAGETARLLELEGKPVVVRGKVSRLGKTANGSIHFINFAEADRDGFVAIVRQRHYEAIALAVGGEFEAVLSGKTVEVRGKVAIFKGEPQVEITSPEQIRVEN